MQKVYLYNTLTRKKEEFVPMNGNKVNLFLCGPTVYDFPHLGHAKLYVQFDFIVKYLRVIGYDVFFLENITNIDDKIIIRAKEKGVEWKMFADEYENIFMEDMASLGITAVSWYARATDYIPQIVKQVKTLIEKGFAYAIDDGIYFEVAKFPGYGKLSGRTEVKEDDGVSRIDENEDKRGWNDFCLWKISKEGEPYWETELGKGRPGWHIEDTAISESFFGSQYDVHGGGPDLIFPHHEAEITQMEAASGKSPFVRYWLHVGFLNVDSRKMGKSKGNFKIIRDVLKEYDYRVIRYLFLSANYRSPIDFSPVTLEQAKSSIKRIDDFTSRIDRNFEDPEEKIMTEKYESEIMKMLANDIDTPNALSQLFEFIRKSNKLRKMGKYSYEMINRLNQMFGFFSLADNTIPLEVEELGKQRLKAKLDKDWVMADRLRDEIQQKGYIIEDSETGYRFKKV